MRMILILCLLTLVSCASKVMDNGRLKIPPYSIEETKKEFGNPISSDTLNIKKESSLHEYQSGLYKFLNQDIDSTIFIENHYKAESNYQLVIWFKQVNSKWTVIDALKWHKSINF